MRSWDSTTIIEHLDLRTDADRRILPDDPVMRFLALARRLRRQVVLQPGRHRWNYEGNTEAAGWQITEELDDRWVPWWADAAQRRRHVRANCTKLGVLDGTIDAWMSDVVVPWFDALEAHLGDGYLLGGRPSLADFAIYGANVAHFVGDPVCRDLVGAHSPDAVAHTHRLSMPQRHTFGDWAAAC